MRLWFALVLAGGCAAAGVPNPAGDDNQTPVDARVVVPPDACPDTDNDGACNAVDKCPGFDDRLDTDADTVADGCDKCPGGDDRIDANNNQIPDCSEVQTRTIDVKKVGADYWRGWHTAGGAAHTNSNDNTLTGTSGTTVYNSYFVFSLAGFTATTITQVTLELEVESYVSGDANEVLSVWDVSTPSATVEASGTNATIFNDLGGGVKYGMATLTSASVSTTTPVQFALATQANTDLKARLGGEFVVGLHVDNAPGYVRFSALSEARIARLVIKYLP